MDFDRLKKIAKKKGFTVKKMMEEIGRSEPNFYRWVKRNSLEVSDLEKISLLLQVPIAYFFESADNIDKANDISFNYQRLKGDNNILSNGKEKKDIAIAKLRSQLEFFTYRAESCESIIKEKERVIESLNAQIELLIDKN